VDEVIGSALVLAMAAEHRDEVSRILPDEAGKTFTLKELVRLLDALPPCPSTGDPDEILAGRVAEADALRGAASRASRGRDEDVTDPLGRRMWTFRAVASDLQEWCGRLVDGLFGPVPAWADAEEV
jgi:protein-tyrosine-phosphatase